LAIGGLDIGRAEDDAREVLAAATLPRPALARQGQRATPAPGGDGDLPPAIARDRLAAFFETE